MAYTEIQAKVSKTAAFAGSSVDISGVTGDFVIQIRVFSLTAGKKARLSLYDSVNAFTAKLPVWTRGFVGEISGDGIFQVRIHKRELIGARFGTASAVLRLEVDSIDGSATIEYDATLEA